MASDNQDKHAKAPNTSVSRQMIDFWVI